MKSVVVIALIVFVSLANAQNFGTELSNLNFRNIIGGPMVATIQAQALAAKTTTDFISEVGFDTSNGNTVRTVSFEYLKNDGNQTRNFTLTVPLIMLMPIPYIEVDVLQIDLNVDLKSVQTNKFESNFNAYASVNYRSGWFFGSVSFTGGFSSQRTTKDEGRVEREYQLEVHVTAGQGGLPKGTERVLDILESVIVETKA